MWGEMGWLGTDSENVMVVQLIPDPDTLPITGLDKDTESAVGNSNHILIPWRRSGLRVGRVKSPE